APAGAISAPSRAIAVASAMSVKPISAGVAANAPIAHRLANTIAAAKRMSRSRLNPLSPRPACTRSLSWGAGLARRSHTALAPRRQSPARDAGHEQDGLLCVGAFAEPG